LTKDTSVKIFMKIGSVFSRDTSQMVENAVSYNVEELFINFSIQMQM